MIDSDFFRVQRTKSGELGPLKVEDVNLNRPKLPFPKNHILAAGYAAV